MQVQLAYGRKGLTVELPDGTELISPQYVPGLPDETAALRGALRHPIASSPLCEKVRPGDRVVIVHSDLTRPMPNDRVLPVLLEELEAAGVRRPDITLLNALGTHRAQSSEELVDMLGARVVENYRCLQHDCHDDAMLVSLGSTRFGHPVRINRRYMEAEVKILTGFIEPHLFAGFSGGPKGVLPSIAGAESVLSNHGTQMVGHPNATWGICPGNPLWEEMLEVALMTEPSFLLNVTLNRDREITGIFAGELEAAHAAGREFCRGSAMVPVPHTYDVVITSNSGYPLDLNLYQAVKGMSAAARIVRPGGAIIIAAECWDGIPEHGDYARLLRSVDSPRALLEMVQQPGFACMDQWEVQVQAMVQLRAEVHVYADGLSDQQLREALMIPCRSVEESLERLLKRFGPGASVCAMPEGPQTIPTVEERSE